MKLDSPLRKTRDAPQARDSDFVAYLKNDFAFRCRKNPSYRLAAFARLIETDLSTLSKVFKGTRTLKSRAIRRIGIKLGLDPTRVDVFASQALRSNAKTQPRTDAIQSSGDYPTISIDSFQMISDWYHYAILELIALPHFKSSVHWIARALRITPTEARLAVERLKTLGMIEETKDGKIVDRSGGYTSTLANDFSAAAFRNLQKQILEKGVQALEEIPFEKRSQTSMTMAIDPAKIPIAKKMIQKFQEELNAFLGVTTKTTGGEVYHLGVSLYPVSFSPPQPEKIPVQKPRKTTPERQSL